MEKSVRSSVNLDTPCGALLRELEQIWTEIGEREEDKDRMLMELEKECMRVYHRKVDQGNAERTQLRQSLALKEAELAALSASLGENSPQLKVNERQTSLKERLASVTPVLEHLRLKKEERVRQFTDLQSQIEKIKSEIAGLKYDSGSTKATMDEHDLSTRRLTEYQNRLRNLQKEKSDRVEKVLQYVNEVHSLCLVLGMDFARTVKEVHPSLHGAKSEKATNISDSTLEGLAQTVMNLKTKRKSRVQKLRETVEKLLKLWNLMETTEEDRLHFAKVANVLGYSEEEITSPGVLSTETLKETEVEVDRLTKLKASRMKELVLKRRCELEEICKSAHTEPDISTAPDKIIALVDSGLVDPSELLSTVETQIVKAKEECLSRKEIMDRVNKWLVASEEENWLKEYNQDDNRYSAGRGAHLNLKRAEKARMLIQKIPTMVDNLMSKIFAWEDEKKKPFLFDGDRLVAILEEYKLSRLQKEEEERCYRDHKKLQSLLNTERELVFGSKAGPRKTSSFNRRTSGNHPNGSGAGFMTPAPRRGSAISSATPELLTPRSYSGNNSHFRVNRRLSTMPLNFSTVSNEDSISSFASISGSEHDSTLLLQ